MKRFMYLILGVSTLLLSACKDTADVRQAEGGYTYKTSGVVTINQAGETSEVHLTPETGTMVLTSNRNGSEATLSFNHSGGDTYDMQVRLENDSIFLDPLSRTIDVEVSTDTLAFGTVTHQREAFEVMVNGEGKLMSNGDVCLQLRYAGHALNENYTLTGKDIHVHCKRNAR